jgi:hypothetical protein
MSATLKIMAYIDHYEKPLSGVIFNTGTISEGFEKMFK